MPTLWKIGSNPAREVLLVGLFILSGLNIFAQGFKVSGTIVDAVSGNPIPNVTVYINGTSKGTITDPEGNFKLHGVKVPCELIISHVSYEINGIPLRDAARLEELWFSMNPKVVLLEEVTVIRQHVRDDYLNKFKLWFLGREYDKYKADILNDSVLIFLGSDDDHFSVHANEPILVYLPYTGYRLKVDLLKFDLQYKKELRGYHCSILGYYYFEPIEQKSHRKQRIVARNRVEHYYNSIMHFCRSLYHNSLAENGYEFERSCQPDEPDVSNLHTSPDFVASYTPDQFGNQQMLLTDFACRNFQIIFYTNARKRPLDLTYPDSSPDRVWRSRLTFLEDTIRIYPSGRIPDNSILFGNTIGMKGVTSMLPEDYIPSMQ